jgi:hypothetical protein
MATGTPTKRRQVLDHWTSVLSEHLPSMSRPEIKGLALWSIGIVLARSSSLHAVVLALTCWLAFKASSLRRRLQEWYSEADAKKGHGSGAWGVHRRDWDPNTVSAELLEWIVEDWPGKQLVVVLDPTSFEDRFTVLNISVVYRGCVVPVIWTVVEEGKPGAWEPRWEQMLRTLANHLPEGWQVLVLADRGMYSPRLFHCVVQLHWHPFLRIHAAGFYRPVGSQKWLDLHDLQPKLGTTQVIDAEVFKNEEGRLDCTLLAFQGEGYAQAWLIVTDLSVEVACASWYGLRGWIEQGYKRIKGEGWNLPRTRVSTCERLARRWLAVAVATMWVLKAGGAAEVDESMAKAQTPQPSDEPIPRLPDRNRREQPEKPSDPASSKPHRIWSVFARGWNVVRNTLAVGALLLGTWHPEPWPDHPSHGLPPTPAAYVGQTDQHPTKDGLRTTTAATKSIKHTDDSS